METLSVQRNDGPDGPRLEVTGELTYDALRPLRAELFALASAGGADLTLDLRRVGFLDNDALALLVMACKRLMANGRKLHLETSLGSQPDRLLRLRRLDAVMPLRSLPALM